MTALLTDNLPLLAGAPNGIKKLRELVLELAVHGKLLQQDANDGHASDWLGRVEMEKSRLFEAGLLKKIKKTPGVELSIEVARIPNSWRWVTLSSITLGMDSGWSPACEPTPSPDNDTWGVLKTTAVQVMQFHQEENKELPAYLEPRPEAEVKAGDILFTRAGPTNRVGISCLVESTRPRLMISDKIIRFHPIEAGTFGRYIALCLNAGSTARYLDTAKSGMAASQVNISQEKLKLAPIPLAPLPEQHRIVAKVDELMVLCDRLELQQVDAESTHAQLVQALLDSLTHASDATDFATNWQRLAEHFHTLFTTEPSIDALKQTLLQLAVMGKLVPQDPNDEPASELLKRIAEEKSRLVAKGKLKKQKSLPDVDEEEKPYALPSSWKWARFDSVSNTRLGKMLDKAKNKGELRPYLRNTNVQWFNFEIDDLKSMRFEEHELDEYRVTPGDLVICEGGEPGRCAVWEGEVEDMFIQKALHRARPWLGISPFFLQSCLKAAANSGYLSQFFTGATIKHFSGEKLAKYPVPLPPLAEQYRIVAKVNQLMALCDRLKTRLTQSRQLNEQLTSTLVERALAEDALQAPIATDRQTTRTLLAAEITHRLHSQRTFGQRKLQKVIYLAEHAARLAAIQGDYLRDAAGPHDRQLMNQIEGELQNHKWYERIERETVGYTYRPLPQAGQHQQAYENAWLAAERASIEQVIELMRDWDTDRCEMTVTLYAAWNDFILEGRPVTDEAIVDEVMHSWNDTKLRFGKIEWLAVLAEIKKHKILMPTGFGKRTKGGMLSLPGFE